MPHISAPRKTTYKALGLLAPSSRIEPRVEQAGNMASDPGSDSQGILERSFSLQLSQEITEGVPPTDAPIALSQLTCGPYVVLDYPGAFWLNGGDPADWRFRSRSSSTTTGRDALMHPTWYSPMVMRTWTQLAEWPLDRSRMPALPPFSIHPPVFKSMDGQRSCWPLDDARESEITERCKRTPCIALNGMTRCPLTEQRYLLGSCKDADALRIPHWSWDYSVACNEQESGTTITEGEQTIGSLRRPGGAKPRSREARVYLSSFAGLDRGRKYEPSEAGDVFKLLLGREASRRIPSKPRIASV